MRSRRRRREPERRPLTHPRCRAYRPRPTVRLHPRSLAAALALTALACGSQPQAVSGPLDRLTFPTAVAVRGQDLVVVSSNFDLTFSTADGGSVLAVPLAAGTPRGTNIGSLGGELAIADASCGLATPVALVPSRSTTELYRLTLGADGVPTCDGDCALPLRGDLADPYGVALACGPLGAKRVFVSHLRTPSLVGYVTMITLDPDREKWRVQVGNAGPGPARSFAYDADRDRVYFTGVSTGAVSLFRWYDFAGSDCQIDVAATDPAACPLGAIDVSTVIRGADLRGIALSNPVPGKPRRAYVAARVFDADVAASIGGRPSYDVAGVLLVIDLEEGPGGRPQPRLVNWVDAGLGASEVAVLPPRPNVACAAAGGCPQRDLVAVTAGDDGLVWSYDDEVGEMRKVFGRNPESGTPDLGRYPYGLAVSRPEATQPPSSLAACQSAGACARVYVGSFQDASVSAVDVPLADPGSAEILKVGGTTWRIGGAP